jgi:hypothetical protein
MFNLQNYEIIYIFLLTVFLTFLYKLEEAIETERYKTKSKLTLFLLMTISSIIAGIIGTICFYTLQEMALKFTIFDIKIELQLWANIFISITIPFFYREMIQVAKRRITNFSSKE